MAILFKETYESKLILIEIPIFLTEMQKLVLKFVWNDIGPLNSQTNFGKEEQSLNISTSLFQTLLKSYTN
jgi:hypothetical protein